MRAGDPGLRGPRTLHGGWARRACPGAKVSLLRPSLRPRPSALQGQGPAHMTAWGRGSPACPGFEGACALFPGGLSLSLRDGSGSSGGAWPRGGVLPVPVCQGQTSPNPGGFWVSVWPSLPMARPSMVASLLAPGVLFRCSGQRRGPGSRAPSAASRRASGWPVSGRSQSPSPGSALNLLGATGDGGRSASVHSAVMCGHGAVSLPPRSDAILGPEEHPRGDSARQLRRHLWGCC